MVASFPGASYPSYAANPGLASATPVGAQSTPPMFGNDSVRFGAKAATADAEADESPKGPGYGIRLKEEVKEAWSKSRCCCCLGFLLLPFRIPLAFIKAIKSGE